MITYCKCGWMVSHYTAVNVECPQCHKPIVCEGPDKPTTPKAWPLWASMLRRLAKPTDTGVGDTVERLLGESGKAYKRLRQRFRGGKCGCNKRKARWNNLYRYDEQNFTS